MSDHALILITCGDEEEARTIARRLVADKMAAGVQILPIDSVYRWAGRIVEDNEHLLIAKTRHDRFEALRGLVTSIHSYEVPPIVLVDIESANTPYLDWIDETTGS